MITLYQFRPVWGLPNLSPFCCKIETYLRMNGIDYETADSAPPLAPRRKLPYIVDGDISVADSRLIIEHLNAAYDVDLDRNLSVRDRADSLAYERMIEDDLFWVMLWTRWCRPENWAINRDAIFGRFPPGLRHIAAPLARRKIRKDAWSQGIGRHSEEDIIAFGNRGLDALSAFLGDKAFFMGDQPTTIDASAFGLLINIAWCPIESGFKNHAAELKNLIAFCERMWDRYFKELPRPV